MSKYDVSIIIPVYNGEKTIKKCVDSALNQTLCRVQVIIVNDGSNDNTQAMLSEYQEREDVSVIFKENTGVSDTRNIGINNVIGKYLFFLDADDWIDSHLIGQMYIFATKYDLDLIACEHSESNSTRVDNNSDASSKFIALDRNEIGRHLLDIFPQSACAKLFRTKIVKDNSIIFPTSMSHGEDMYFTYSFLLKAGSIGKINNAYYHIQNVNPNSLSKRYITDLGTALEEQYSLYCKLFDRFPETIRVFNMKKMYLPVLLFSAFSDNQFKIGNDSSFRLKVKRIRAFFNKNHDWYNNKKLKAKPVIPHNAYKKIVYFIVRLNIPFLVGIFFEVKELIKRAKYRKMR